MRRGFIQKTRKDFLNNRFYSAYLSDYQKVEKGCFNDLSAGNQFQNASDVLYHIVSTNREISFCCFFVCCFFFFF